MTCLNDSKQNGNSSVSHQDWQSTLERTLPLLGHRNWLVIADSAYPLQSRPGVQTIFADESHQVVLEKTLAMLRASRHVRPVVHLDRELAFLDDQAPEVRPFRQWLEAALANETVQTSLHEEIISTLDRVGQMFSVLVVKTNMTIPYTSVFFELDCRYWDVASEGRMRAEMLREHSAALTS
jgi:L-fucose mutarotase/ribose pyranase (RbsD/FucU family)